MLRATRRALASTESFLPASTLGRIELWTYFIAMRSERIRPLGGGSKNSDGVAPLDKVPATFGIPLSRGGAKFADSTIWRGASPRYSAISWGESTPDSTTWRGVFDIRPFYGGWSLIRPLSGGISGPISRSNCCFSPVSTNGRGDGSGVPTTPRGESYARAAIAARPGANRTAHSSHLLTHLVFGKSSSSTS